MKRLRKYKLDLESIGSSLGFEGELIWAGLDWRGPDIAQWAKITGHSPV